MAFTEAIRTNYDTDNPDAEDASPDHKAAYSPIIGMPLTIVLDGQGLGASVEGGEPIRAKLTALGEANFVASAMAKEVFADRSIMSNFAEQQYVLLPYREVKVGEAWKKTHHDVYPNVGKVIVQYDCTLASVEGDTALVNFKGTVTKDPDEKPTKEFRPGAMEGSFSGTANFSISQSRFVSLQTDTTATIHVQPWWSKDQTVPLMKLEGQTKTGFTVTSAADRMARKSEIAARVAAAKAAREAEEAAAMAGPVDPPSMPNEPVAWLQWGGPNRNFCSDATGLANRWPKDGPPKLWERKLGDGYSAVLCDGATLYTHYSVRDKADPFQGEEVIVALDAKSGETRWEHKYAAPWPKDMQMEFGAGPHSTPLIDGGKLFTVGTTAILTCVDAQTGKPLWSKDLHKEFKAALNGRGFGSSPLAYKGNILLPVSSDKDHGLMAFSQADGSVAWKGGDFEPGYASLFAINALGREQLVAFTGKNVCGLNPGDAAVLWSVEHPTQFGANISTPVWDEKDQSLFISAAYGMGSRGVKLEKSGDQIAAKETWYNNKMKIQHATAVRVGDWVYGSSGDFGPAFFACVNAKTGEFGWRQRGIAKANVILADGKLIILDEDGTLFLVKADPAQYRLLGKAPGIASKVAWTVPTLYGRTLYVRDREKIAALDVGASISP
jgi:outer membrane protein assembly factor BamB